MSKRHSLEKIGVQAYEDPTRTADGPAAVILLQGVTSLPERAEFRLRPLETAPGLPPPDGWPTGDLAPLESRLTSEGLEIAIGAELADNDRLLPGTLVELVMPGAGVRGEFAWPNIAPSLKPRRRPVIAAPQRREPPAGETAAPAAPRPRRDAETEIQASLATIESALRGDSPPVRAAPSPAVPPPAAAGQRESWPIAKPNPALRPQEETIAMAEAKPTPPLGRPLNGGSAPGPETAGRVADDGGTPFYQSARGASLGDAVSGPTGRKRDLVVPSLLVAGAFAMIGLVYLISLASQGPPAPAPQAPPAATATASPSAPGSFVASNPAPIVAEAGPVLFESLAAGTTSPKGVSVRGLSATQALETALPLLQDVGPTRDTGETAFWLKRFIQASLGDERLKRALTRLGTLYAEPSSGAPDFVKARAVWELASTAGDPVAMCFLGVLYEHGLGVEINRGSALQWYERSKQAGGCPGVEESIARVRQ
jgi:hypothetical protein